MKPSVEFLEPGSEIPFKEIEQWRADTFPRIGECIYLDKQYRIVDITHHGGDPHIAVEVREEPVTIGGEEDEQ